MMYSLNVALMVCSIYLVAFLIVFQAVTFFSINPLLDWPAICLYSFLGSGIFCTAGFLIDFWANIPLDFPVQNSVTKWKYRIFAVVLLYSFINIVIYMNITGGNIEESFNGQHAITSHGRLVRNLSKDEYAWPSCFHLRVVSCYIFLGCWYLLAYFHHAITFCKNPKKITCSFR